MSYKWTIEIEVDPRWVADGLDLSNPDYVHEIITDYFRYTPMDAFSVRVVEAPDPSDIRKEQGGE